MYLLKFAGLSYMSVTRCHVLVFCLEAAISQDLFWSLPQGLFETGSGSVYIVVGTVLVFLILTSACRQRTLFHEREGGV